ncbi:MAG: hypothetical protein D6758_04855 [Gammaproteobacteria bacterium]|nr:MAG: hypothetical protein D6758_04855 [Gammaproteobacteria bacterium]
MTATQVTLAIGILVLVTVVIVYFVRAREKARIEQARLLHSLQQRLRRLMRLVSDLPAQYSTPDIKALILREAEETLNQIRTIDPRPEYDEHAITLKAYGENLNAGEGVKIKPVTQPDKAKEIRKLLEALYKFIDSQVRKKRLDPATGKKHLAQTAFLMAKCMADVHTHRAKKAADSGKPRVAIHHYHEAIALMEKLSNNPLAAKHIVVYRKRMAELEKQAEEALRAAAPAKEDKAAKLNEEWEKALSEDDSWKKKQTYD